MFSCHAEKAGFEKFFKFLDEFKQRDKNLDKAEEQTTNDSIQILAFSKEGSSVG